MNRTNRFMDMDNGPGGKGGGGRWGEKFKLFLQLKK